jgi:hypothetical protein
MIIQKLVSILKSTGYHFVTFTIEAQQDQLTLIHSPLTSLPLYISVCDTEGQIYTRVCIARTGGWPNLKEKYLKNDVK